MSKSFPSIKKGAWPSDRVERRKVDDLIPYARNARTHTEAQIAQVAASIREWGWTNPVLIAEDGTIIAGHCRVLAARKLGIDEIPVMIASGWTKAQTKAYVLADNQLALNAGWDMELLKVELDDLGGLNFDIGLIGFDDKMLGAIAAIGGGTGLTDPDAVPEAPATPVAVSGDLWALGSHRLLCGDSTSATDVEKVLGPVRPHLMVTDPPYGVEYDASWRNTRGIGKGGALGKVANDDKADWREAWALFPGDVAYVWCASLFSPTVAEGLESVGFALRSLIIWDKTRLVISRCDYHWQHEPCWYAVRKGKNGHWSGDRKQTTIWAIPKPQKSETGHSTQKPVECMKRPIENNSSPGQAVYEPFSGSGTTIIAAEMTGRVCHAIELNPAYIDVAIKRWQDFTGQQATLDGQPFDDLAATRLKAA